MHLHAIDIAIILAYLGTSVFVGWWVSRRASRDLKSYFLGGNVMPWYVLGVSDASGMFDIAGTMWLVYIMFVYGLKSVFIPWLWPVFNQIFLAAYLSRWLRRSGAMTGAEWIKTRFGTGRGAELSHLIVVVFALVSVVAFLSYAFKGIGKFATDFLPWHLERERVRPHPDGDYHLLCGERRDVQRRHYGSDSVLYPARPPRSFSASSP